jgi:hypothetical protein
MNNNFIGTSQTAGFMTDNTTSPGDFRIFRFEDFPLLYIEFFTSSAKLAATCCI